LRQSGIDDRRGVRGTDTDPSGELNGGANLYAFVGNDPVHKTDAHGLSPIPGENLVPISLNLAPSTSGDALNLNLVKPSEPRYIPREGLSTARRYFRTASDEELKRAGFDDLDIARAGDEYVADRNSQLRAVSIDPALARSKDI
jgi:hypothetical protein